MWITDKQANSIIFSGWWLVTKGTDGERGGQEDIGYISADYVKPYKQYNKWTEASGEEDIQKYLGFVCRENTELEHASAMPPKYVAIENYVTEDPRQLCLRKEEVVMVAEMSEDGIKAYSCVIVVIILGCKNFRMVAGCKWRETRVGACILPATLHWESNS